MKKSLLIGFVALFMFGVAIAQGIATLPDLTLKDMHGKTLNVQDYGKSGKITVFSFWATWCGPCKKELKNINEHLEDWQTKYNMQLVGVCTDNSKNTVKVKPYVDGQGWDFDVLMDVNEEFKRAINAPSIPFTLVVDEKGNVVYTHTGYVEGDEFELEKKLIELTSVKK